MNKLLLLGAVSFAALASAQAQTEPMPGKVGTVTVNLTVTTEIGGFNGESTKVVIDTETESKELHKTVASKAKYSTKQYISDLLARYELEGVASDYSIKFVVFPNGDEYYFLVNKDASVIRQIGANSTGSGYTTAGISTYYATDDYHESTVYSESSSNTSKTNNDVTTDSHSGTYTYQAPGTYIYFNPTGENRFECFALVKGGGSYKSSATFEGESETPSTSSSSSTVSATNYTGIVGTNYEGAMITGTMTVSALKNVADVTAFYTVLYPPE